MNIALDYDDTFTADPGLWFEFIRNAQSRGHNIYVVTYRHESLGWDVRAVFDPMNIPIIFTNHNQKRPFIQARNIRIDVWIDDAPERIV